ncbi:hypothetical protein [Enterococcus sp. AZ192]|uniref:hypothetical protein n=1 Tax=unclassified Enterococcus TaxID=2608891 RepID=UPI003D278215
MEGITIFNFKINNASEYDFCQINLSLGNESIGDYEQFILAGTLKLSLDELLLKLKKTPTIICTYNNIENLMKKNFFSFPENSILPVGIESFDGDFAIFVNINMKDYLLYQTYNGTNYSVYPLNKKEYTESIRQVLNNLK